MFLIVSLKYVYVLRMEVKDILHCSTEHYTHISGNVAALCRYISTLIHCEKNYKRIVN